MKRSIPQRMLPVPYAFILPNPEGLSHEEAEAIIQRLEREVKENRSVNDEHLDNALFRIKLCAFLRGLTAPWGVSSLSSPHYSWCPGEVWDAYLGVDFREEDMTSTQ